MNTNDVIAKLRERLETVRGALDSAKQSIVVLESEAQKVAIALDVLQQMADSEKAGNVMGPPEKDSDQFRLVVDSFSTANLPRINFGRPPPLLHTAAMPPSIKHLVTTLFESDKPLTRMDVMEAINVQKPDANPGTVATTLSKMVQDGFLVREGNYYKRKDGIASAANTSDADDLL